MPFTFLLWHCLRPGQTSVGAGKVRAGFDGREKDECVLVFDLDGNEDFRKHFAIRNERVCDHLFFHRKAHGPATLVFVELKGSDVSRGISQLEKTLEVVRPRLPSYARRSLVAVVVKWGGAPRADDNLRKRFSKSLGVPLYIESGSVNLRSLLSRRRSAAE